MDESQFAKQQLRNEEQIPTYINISIQLEPLIQIQTENDHDFYQGAEKSPFLEAGTMWVREIDHKFKRSPRMVKVFLENIDG